ncbi:MAG TPA: hypothetical protein VGE72_01940 [Azospirillum sp.]
MDARPFPASRGTEIQRALSAVADLPRFAATGTSPQRRPPLSLPIVRALAVRALAERVAGSASGPDVTILSGHLMLVTVHHRDGAAIAAELARRFHHALDAGAAAILDDYTYELLLAHDRLVAAWAAAHGVRPALTYGDRIRVVTNDRDWRPVEVTGEIVGIDAAHAKYHVFSEALGHSPDGPGPAFRAIPFEDVRAIGAAAGEESARDAA